MTATKQALDSPLSSLNKYHEVLFGAVSKVTRPAFDCSGCAKDNSSEESMSNSRGEF